ncbi:MAG TPA: AsmA family protein [Caulobacteraceae bacterium]
MPEKVRLPKRGTRHWGIAGVVLLIAAVILFLWIFDWNWLRPPLAAVASDRLNREVEITGDLDVHPWSLSPSAEVHGVTISQPDFLKGQMASADNIAVKVKLLPLFRGRQILEKLEVIRPRVVLRRDAKGRNNWQFGDPEKNEPTKLPAIQHFWVRDGQIDFRDAIRNLTLNGTVNTSEHTVGPDKGSFELVSKGTINKEPFTLTVHGAPLLHVTPDKPYPFTADLRSGSTHATADAQIDRPFDLSRFGGKMTLTGDDLADLYRLTGLALPNTPPYRVNGRLRRNEARYDFDDFSGRIGDSDIAGDLYVRTDLERMYLNAQARSRLLDFDDVGPIFGLPPATGRGETASPEQRAQAGSASPRVRGRILPDARLNVERIRAMDADVTYRAERVNAPGWPLRKVQADLKLKDGVLNANPVSFDFSRGSLDGKIKLDASSATPRTDVDLRLYNARIEDWVKFKSAGAPVIEGKVVARARLTGYGDSVAKAAASADGQVTLAMPGGTMRQAFAELLGINVTKGLIMLFKEDPRGTPINCAVADFKATNGVLNAQTLVLDTGVVVANGEGHVDMRNETMDFKIDGDSKKFRLVRLLSPITIKGSWLKAKIGIEPGPAIAQGVIGLGLAALLHPLAAIIPFVEPGGADDADCAGLLAQAAAKGAR